MGGSSSVDGVFYTHPQNGVDKEGNPKFDRSTVVAAKYLTIVGQKVRDPYFTTSDGGSNHNPLYSKLNANGTVDKSSVTRNVANYLIVPANYDISEAVEFATELNAYVIAASAVSPALGRAVGQALIGINFLPGHGQDLQRGLRWHVPPHETNPVFKDAASWNFGFITQQVNIPNNDAKRGGGLLNRAEYFNDRFLYWDRICQHDKTQTP